MTPHSLERDFYLQHFRGRSIMLAVDQADPDDAVGHLSQVLSDGGATVVRVVSSSAHAGTPQGPTPVRTSSTTLAAAAASCLRELHAGESVEVLVDDDLAVLDAGLELASRLQPSKLVLVASDAPTPQTRDAAFATVDEQHDRVPALQQRAAQALAAGVHSVNVCRIEGLERELLSYQGSGVLFTRRPYAEVGPLRLDDRRQVHRLVSWGMQEGFLKPRTDDEVVSLMLSGFVAHIDDGQPAGFAALLDEPYADEGMAEVAALTTISRFAGGGVGSQLVRHMVRAAGQRGVRMVFACTTSPEAAGFFRAVGFDDIGLDAVPAAKWAGYDGARRASLTALGCPT